MTVARTASKTMDVYLVPVSASQYALYCESDHDAIEEDSAERSRPGIVRRLYRQFRDVLAVEQEHRRARALASAPAGRGWRTWGVRLRNRVLGWIAQAVAEQRLLWQLRRQRDAVLLYPDDLDERHSMVIARGILQRDADRHRFWMVIDSVALLLTSVFTIVPGPNIIWWYFLFRTVGHLLSWRGARRGLDGVSWDAQPSGPLAELRQIMALAPDHRAEHVRDVASRLHLEHLAAFFERSAVRSA